MTFFPRKPHVITDGEYPIYVRISTAGRKTEFTIGRKVNPDNWDQRDARKPSASPGATSS